MLILVPEKSNFSRSNLVTENADSPSGDQFRFRIFPAAVHDTFRLLLGGVLLKNFFFFVTETSDKKARVFVPDIHYQPSLIFEGRVALNGNIRLNWKVLSGTNTYRKRYNL